MAFFPFMGRQVQTFRETRVVHLSGLYFDTKPILVGLMIKYVYIGWIKGNLASNWANSLFSTLVQTQKSIILIFSVNKNREIISKNVLYHFMNVYHIISYHVFKLILMFLRVFNSSQKRHEFELTSTQSRVIEK